MTQLILDGIELPESMHGGYSVDRTQLYVEKEMVTGRITRELRGTVLNVSYQYGYFTDEMKNKVIAACQKGMTTPIVCGVLEPGSSGELTYSTFFVTSFSRPRFMWSRNVLDAAPVPMWADFNISLREVAPSD